MEASCQRANESQAAKAPTVVSHHVFQRAQARDPGLVSTQDFGPGAKVIREFLAVSAPHHAVAAEVVDVCVERHIVRRPVACSQCVWGRRLSLFITYILTYFT